MAFHVCLVCCSRMAGNRKRQCSVLCSVAVILFLFSLVPGLTCFSLRGLRRKGQQEKLVSEAARNVRGRVLFNGEDLNFESRSVAAEDGGLVHVDLPQSDDTGMLEQTFQRETAEEAAWRRLNPTLSCGQTKMKLKAMGPGAAGFQLDMGLFNGIAHTLPLIQVPNSCGYSMRQNPLGLILVVPYNGCHVIQKNGYHVLPLTWLKNPVQLVCPTSQSSEATAQPTTAMNPPANPNYQPYLSMHHPFSWPYYNMQPIVQPVTTTAGQPKTTTEPATTTTMPVLTTGSAPAMDPPANPIYQHYQHYLPMYRPFSWPYYSGQPMVPPVPPTTTGQPATTTAEPATTPVPTTEDEPVIEPVYPYYQNKYPYIWYPFSNVPETTLPPTTTAASPTTASPPPNPYYYPYYQYQLAGIPSQSQLSYPFIQPRYQQKLNPSTAFSPQSDSSLSTASASTPACPYKTSSGSYPDLRQYSAYNWFPFSQHTWHRNEAGEFPYAWKYRSQAGYVPGVHAPVQPYPDFLYQQPMPWFSYSGQENAQIN